jgi:CheY-specific phosphatase CheX
MNHDEIDPETREALLGPFLEAVAVALREMAGIEPVVRGCHRAPRCQPSGDTSVVLPLKAARPLALVLTFPGPVGTALARRILAEAAQEPSPELIADCLGEVANIAAGQAKALLHGTPHAFALTLPRVLSAEAQESSLPQGQECLFAEMGSELGDFTLQLVVG